jgi:cell division control protein 6
VLSEIYKKITEIEPPTSGIALKKLYGKIAKALAAKNKCLFVVLDDADFLVLRKIFNDVVNNILRLNEEYPLHIGLGTVHSIQCPALDFRLTSVFLPTLIKFPVYTWDETFNILSTRAKIGLYPGVAGKGIIEKITDCTIQKGDIRFGIDLLDRSVRNAEKRASTCVDFIDVDAALIGASKDRMERYLKVFTDTESALLQIASEMGMSQSGDLYREFNKRTKKGYTTFHKTLNKLISTKLIDTRIENRGKNGRTRIISLKHPVPG